MDHNIHIRFSAKGILDILNPTLEDRILSVKCFPKNHVILNDEEFNIVNKDVFNLYLNNGIFSGAYFLSNVGDDVKSFFKRKFDLDFQLYMYESLIEKYTYIPYGCKRLFAKKFKKLICLI